jgi:PAS domain S-box-containing protein
MKDLLRDTRQDLAKTRRALRVSEATSRSQAEQLRALSDELITILNTAGVGITRCSRDLRYLRANEAYATIVGLPLDKIIGRPIVEVVGEAAFTTIRPHIERVLAGERVEYEGVVSIHKGVERSTFRVVYVPDRHPNGSVIGWIAWVTDITSSKQAEARLVERKAQLDFAGKIAKIGSFTYDHATQKIQLSPGCATIYGLPEGTHAISSGYWWTLLHPEDLPRLEATARRSVTNGESELVLEFRALRHGEVRWIEARALILYNKAGKLVQIIGAQIDVTERRKADDHKNLLISELDHRVKNVLACVAAIAQRARESSRSADEFLDVLNGRIHSLAHTHALLSQSRWEGVCLGELVRSELAFCTKDDSVLIEGPGVVLVAEAAEPVAMVLHELATNAAKYGALSNGHGRVFVRWRLRPRDPSRCKLVVEWQESGGPPVAALIATGYGTSVIRDLIPYELGGTVDYVLAHSGIRCKLEIPSRWLSRKV